MDFDGIERNQTLPNRPNVKTWDKHNFGLSMNDLSGLKHLIEQRMKTLEPDYLNVSHGDIDFITSFCYMILNSRMLEEINYWDHFKDFAERTLSRIQELRG